MGSLLYGKSDIPIETDNQPLETIFKKRLYKALRRLQIICKRLHRWSFAVNYKRGAHQANTLSRAPQPQLSVDNLTGEHIFKVELDTMG